MREFWSSSLGSLRVSNAVQKSRQIPPYHVMVHFQHGTALPDQQVPTFDRLKSHTQQPALFHPSRPAALDVFSRSRMRRFTFARFFRFPLLGGVLAGSDLLPACGPADGEFGAGGCGDSFAPSPAAPRAGGANFE